MGINVNIGDGVTPQPRDSKIGVNINDKPTIGVTISNPNLHEIKFKLNGN